MSTFTEVGDGDLVFERSRGMEDGPVALRCRVSTVPEAYSSITGDRGGNGVDKDTVASGT